VRLTTTSIVVAKGDDAPSISRFHSMLKGASPHTPLCMVMSHDAPAFLPMLRRVPRINPLVTTPSEPLNHYLSNAVSSYLFHGAH